MSFHRPFAWRFDLKLDAVLRAIANGLVPFFRFGLDASRIDAGTGHRYAIALRCIGQGARRLISRHRLHQGLISPKHNYIVVFMIPEPDPDTGCLPPGVHEASWHEVVSRFGGNSHRGRLLDGLLNACRGLAAAGCGEAQLDGSFVTTKTMPGDYDAAWETKGVDPELLDPVLLDMKHPRAAMKAKYLGDLFPASASAAPGVLFRDFSRAIATASGRALC